MNYVRYGSVYAALFTNGIIKIGMTQEKSARHRIVNATTQLERAGEKLAREFSVNCHNFMGLEKQVLEYAKKNGVLANGREWFTGLDFDDVCAFIESKKLIYTTNEIAKLNDEQKLHMDEFFDDLDITKKIQEEKMKFSVARATAKIAERLLKRDGFESWGFAYCDKLFCSYFEHSCAIAMCGMNEEEVVEYIFECATCDDDAYKNELIFCVRDLCENAVKGMMAKVAK